MKTIKRIAILGSGIMGSRIACHFAQCGIPVLLLDRPSEDEKDKNKIVNESLKNALQSSPSPIYSKKFASRITTGNFEDNLKDISNCDWIMEVIIEKLEPKQTLFEKVEQFRKPGSIVSTNTSGIPIHLIAEGRSEDFKKNFIGTHFFNPPRYLRLLEIIPIKETNPNLISFLKEFGSLKLGKEVVLCKDTPAFIANRIGVFSIQALLHSMKELNLTVEEVDKLSGTIMGRPKSATFRTCDVVGLDTLVHVANGLFAVAKSDEQHALFALPEFIQTMINNQWLGDKTKQGFYKKTKGENGEKEILVLDLNTLAYRKQNKVKFASYEAAKLIDDLPSRLKHLYNATDKAGLFYKKMFHSLFAYVSFRMNEIADELKDVDAALRAGFGWELGPFELWDTLGFEACLENMINEGYEVAPWIHEMKKSGFTSFYKNSESTEQFLPAENKYGVIVRSEQARSLDSFQEIIWTNSACTVRDIGDGVLSLSWKSKMNTIGGEVLAGINKAIDLAEEKYNGLVIYNQGDNFSAGANVGMIFMFAVEQEYEELDMAVRYFQKTVMRLRYSNIPVVVAPHGLALGGACEMSMHADATVAHAETYMGLVEMGVGVIPGGAGTKEFALRASDEMKEGDIRLNVLRNRFLTVGQAKLATSAEEAFELGYLSREKDEVCVSRAHQLMRAKEVCLNFHHAGYTAPQERKDITILGNEGLGIVYAGASSMKSGNYISEHDQLISEKLGFVMCGGDLSAPTKVSEQYLLDLERKAFLELCMQRKSLERMQSLINSGKILRN